MNKISFNKICLLIGFFLLIVTTINAQSHIIIKVVADKTQILIGEQINLTVSADVPENELIRFPVIDSLPHFEILEKQKTDTVNTRNGTSLKQIIRITSFDSGHWVIPAFLLADSIQTDTIPIDVGFSAFDPNQDYHDIKDIIPITTDKKKREWWYFAVGGGLVLVLILYLLFRKKKKVSIVKPVEVIDPYKEAMSSLAQLKQEKSESKEYYSTLIGILRIYLFRKKGIQSLQKTTDDIVVQLKAIVTDTSSYAELGKALQLSDFVKFAKYIPSKEDDLHVFKVVSNAIDQIEKNATDVSNAVKKEL